MNNISHAATVFPVERVRETLDYYRDVLGFEITFEWEEPVTYGVLKREDAVSIHIVEKRDRFSPSKEHTAVYIFCNDVDAVYEEMKESGANITTEIGDRDYGMRDFDVTDLNGFQLSFSMAIHQ